MNKFYDDLARYKLRILHAKDHNELRHIFDELELYRKKILHSELYKMQIQCNREIDIAERMIFTAIYEETED